MKPAGKAGAAAPDGETSLMPEETFALRRMTPEDADEVAELIHLSLNFWYGVHSRTPRASLDPALFRVFPDTYEALDPGCCVVAVEGRRGKIVGSCFFHPRATHVSVGIVNTHPAYFGRGIARKMIRAVLDEAGDRPVRLVSSLMNLDSYAVYTRSGFVPRQIFQTMRLDPLPAGGLPPTGPDDARVRAAVPEDASAIAAAEREISGIEREGDWRFFLENAQGIWHVSLLIGGDGYPAGALASVSHPASRMLGPGFARTEAQAAALLRAELSRRAPGDIPTFLIPADAAELVARCYGWGARNVELHVGQVRGAWTKPDGVVFPTFLPETG